MKMSVDEAEDLQSELEVMYSDDTGTSLIGFVSQPFPYTEATDKIAWQYTVEILYRLIKCGLCKVIGMQTVDPGIWPYPSEHSEEAQTRLRKFISDLAQINPFDRSHENFEHIGAWVWPVLYTTELCDRLLDKYNIAAVDSPFSESFIEEVESIFEAHGVPWSEEPLFPVRASGL